jgi:hypothetical protein
MCKATNQGPPIKQDILVVAVFDPGTKPRHSVYFTHGKALQIGIGTGNKYDVQLLCQVKAKQRRVQTSEMQKSQGQTIQKEGTQETRISNRTYHGTR